MLIHFRIHRYDERDHRKGANDYVCDEGAEHPHYGVSDDSLCVDASGYATLVLHKEHATSGKLAEKVARFLAEYYDVLASCKRISSGSITMSVSK